MQFLNYVKLCRRDITAELYNHPRRNAVSNRLLMMGDSVVDATLCILSSPLEAIQSIAYAAINLIGSLFSSRYTLQDAKRYTKLTCKDILFSIPTTFAIAIVFIYQMGRILKEPYLAKPLTTVWQEISSNISAKVQERKPI